MSCVRVREEKQGLLSFAFGQARFIETCRFRGINITYHPILISSLSYEEVVMEQVKGKIKVMYKNAL